MLFTKNDNKHTTKSIKSIHLVGIKILASVFNGGKHCGETGLDNPFLCQNFVLQNRRCQTHSPPNCLIHIVIPVLSQPAAD